MSRDPEITATTAQPESAEIGKPDQQPVSVSGADSPFEGPQYEPPVDKSWLIGVLEDAERAERDWRRRGREIIMIYRNEKATAKGSSLGDTTYNLLYANTEVMLPALYQKPPKPVVRSRFPKVQPPPPPPPMMSPPMPIPGAIPQPGLPPDMALPPDGGQPGNNAGPAALPAVGTPLPMPGQAAPPPIAPGVMGVSPDAGAPTAHTPIGAPPIPPMLGGMPAPPGATPPLGAGLPFPPPPPAPDLGPPPDVIETAAAVMEKALTIVLSDDQSHEATKLAVKDVLLPGRGVCRVRWRPTMKSQPAPPPDPMAGVSGPAIAAGIGDNGGPPMEEVKVWEEVGDEYVYWEDLLLDPVRQVADTGWMAFRHLFDKDGMEREFAGSPEYEKLKSLGKLDELFIWTDESAAKSPVGGGAAMKSAGRLGNRIRKAMVWEFWHKATQRIIWFMREASGLTLRIDQDTMQLMGFFPIPVPMLAVTTSDTRIPRAFFDLYANLAGDADDTSKRISALGRQIKVRGAYNAASREIADILSAGDNKMIPVDGVDLMQGGLSNHIWLVPIVDFMNAFDKLLISRDQQKQSVYEIMGISDIMRGATKASETATAQRMKGNMGMVRLEDQRSAVSNFTLDLLRMKAELICEHFDAETLTRMTGEEVTPEVLAVLRSDFMRVCSIDVETDSTVQADIQAEQQSMAMVLASIQQIMMGAQALLQTGIIPPPQVMMLSLELIKLAVHAVPNSRAVTELINNLQKQLEMMIANPPPPPMPVGPDGAPLGGAPAGLPPGAVAAAPGGPPPNGSMPAALMQ